MSLAKKIEARRAAPKPSGGGDTSDLAVQIANLQRELAEARSKNAEFEKGAATWQQKAEAAEARYTHEKLTRHLYDAAIKAGSVDPDDVVSLVVGKGARIEGDRVVFGQGPEARSADDYIAAFVESKPHLRKSAPVAQGSGAPATQASGAPAAPAAQVIDPRSPTAAAQWTKRNLEALAGGKK